MKFLKEAYGESDKLDDFIYMATREFKTIYKVTLELGNKTRSVRYFGFEDAAREYYNKIIELAKEDKDYYEDSQVSISKIDIVLEEDELDFEYFMNDSEE